MTAVLRLSRAARAALQDVDRLPAVVRGELLRARHPQRLVSAPIVLVRSSDAEQPGS